MAEHNPERIAVSNAFGNNPDDVFGKPTAKPEKKPEGFQEEIPSVESLLEGIVPEGAPAPEVAPALEEVPTEEESPKSDLEGLMARLQTIADAEDVAAEDKTSAEEMIARLEELRAAMTNAEEFLTEKEPAAVVVEETAEVAVV